MVKVALVGSSGYIANRLIPCFERSGYEVIKICNEHADGVYYLDLADVSRFDFDIIRTVDFVVFTAAVSSPDICEARTDECWNINVTGTELFIQKALDIGCKVLFFSSDAVFGADKGVPFTEASEKMPISQYGKMKAKIEELFRKHPCWKAVRLSYVFSCQDKFSQYYLRCIEQQENAEIFHPFYRNVIFLDDLTETVLAILDKWEAIIPSIVNVGADELVSRVKMGDCYNRFLTNQANYTIIAIPEEMARIRPSITQMKSMYLEEILGRKLNSFEENFKKELEQYFAC